MISVEIADNDIVEIHFDKIGIIEVMKYLKELADNDMNDHVHILSPTYGGNDMISECVGVKNNKIHHLKILYWKTKEI